MIINEQEFKARIEYARTLANYNKTELAKVLHMPPSTFRRKMDKPLKLTIEEFFILGNALPNGVLVEYLINAIKKIPLRRGTEKKEIS